MKLSSRVLGANIVATLSARAAAPLLVIGSDVFHRGDLAHVGCFNFIAASRLNAAIVALGVTSTRDLFDHVPPSALVLPQIGAIALAVLGAAFEAKRIGGGQPLETWVATHRAESRKPIVTFASLKMAERKREVGEVTARAARKARKHARRSAAHETRVHRFTTRRAKV